MNALEPDLAMATRFLNAIAPGEEITFQTFDDTKQKRPELARILHGTLEEHSPQLTALQEQGAGVFMTVNRTDGQGRKAANIIEVRATFVDLDGAPLAPVLEAPLKPSITVESSPGRYHAYWLVQNGFPKESFKSMQLSLVHRFNADKSVHDLPRVMRLPGFYHLKAAPFLVKILSIDGANETSHET